MTQQNAESGPSLQPKKKKNLPKFLWVVLGIVAMALLAWNICFVHC